MSIGDITRVVAAFAAAARRLLEAGGKIAEIHAAHGYLLHEFLSPLSNHRDDEYGGSFENRTRIVREVVDAIRGVWPERYPLWVRISATDWTDGGWTIDDSVALAAAAQGARRRSRRLLVGRQRGRRRRSRSAPATRCRSPSGSGARPASRPAPSA